MISKLKTLIKFTIYCIINLFIKPSKEIKTKSILLIRLDAIGDYVLFRNFIEVLKKSKKYKEYNITLLGNSDWKDLSKELDSEYVDGFIWLDKSRFNKDFFYRFQKLQEIVSTGYELVLSPMYSREYFIDNIINFIHAKEKIGSTGNLSNIQNQHKNESDQYYDVLVPATNELMFEFNRNKEFFENILDTKLNITKPHINLKPKELSFLLPQKYAILFIGASTNFRKWGIEGFAKIGVYLKEKYDYEIVLCGAPSDAENSLKFKEYFNGTYINLVAKTSLTELLHVIHNGNLILSNETSAPHFAVTVGTKNIFVIYNGNHYGRFTPYPKEISENYHVIYHPEIEKNIDDYQILSNSYGYESSLDINEITINCVKEKLNEVLDD